MHHRDETGEAEGAGWGRRSKSGVRARKIELPQGFSHGVVRAEIGGGFRALLGGWSGVRARKFRGSSTQFIFYYRR